MFEVFSTLSKDVWLPDYTILSKILNDYVFYFIQPLKHIFNLFISQNIFPEILNIAIIILIYKKSPKIQSENVGNISLISDCKGL